MARKPGVIVLSADGEESFRWLSDGWNDLKKAEGPRARELMARAREAIEAGLDVPDVIARLREAGFSVVRCPDG